MTGGFQAAQASPAKARARHDLRWAARLVAEELTAPGLDPAVSVAMLTDAYLAPLRYATLMLTLARHQAANHTPAGPDIPGAERFCGWCGATTGLVDDSLDPATGERLDSPVWCCSDTDECVARRAERYPTAQT